MPFLVLLLDACAPSVSGVGPGDPDGTTAPPIDTDEVDDSEDTDDTGDTEDTSPVSVTDTFTYARPKVDVLFIVDNSSSMNGKNDTFAEAVESAVTSWLALGIDFQAGVVDIDANEWLGTLEEYEGTRWVDDTTPDPVTTLSELVKGVPDETSEEAGRRAIWLGLRYTADGQPNAGFLREGAELDIVVHSDEDDGSEDEPTHEDLVAYLRELRPDPGSLYFHAISYGTDYSSISDEIGGVTRDVAETPYDAALEAATGMFHRTNVFALAERPDPATLAVSVAGAPLDVAAFRYDPDVNAVDLDGVPLVEGDEVSVSYLPVDP